MQTNIARCSDLPAVRRSVDHLYRLPLRLATGEINKGLVEWDGEDGTWAANTGDLPRELSPAQLMARIVLGQGHWHAKLFECGLWH